MVAPERWLAFVCHLKMKTDDIEKVYFINGDESALTFYWFDGDNITPSQTRGKVWESSWCDTRTLICLWRSKIDSLWTLVLT
jgi:hypothetical protein